MVQNNTIKIISCKFKLFFLIAVLEINANVRTHVCSSNTPMCSSLFINCCSAISNRIQPVNITSVGRGRGRDLIEEQHSILVSHFLY